MSERPSRKVSNAKDWSQDMKDNITENKKDITELDIQTRKVSGENLELGKVKLTEKENSN